MLTTTNFSSVLGTPIFEHYIEECYRDGRCFDVDRWAVDIADSRVDLAAPVAKATLTRAIRVSGRFSNRATVVSFRTEPLVNNYSRKVIGTKIIATIRD